MALFDLSYNQGRTVRPFNKIFFFLIIVSVLKSLFIGPHITEGELEAYQYKTDRYLRLRELLLDHSSDSNLVVMWETDIPLFKTHYQFTKWNLFNNQDIADTS